MASDTVILGKVGASWGVKGWFKVTSNGGKGLGDARVEKLGQGEI